MAAPVGKEFAVEIKSFRTLNSIDSPSAMLDDEMPECLNYIPIGTQLFTIPGYSPDLISIGTTVVKFKFFSIKDPTGQVAQIGVVFCVDGSIHVIEKNSSGIWFDSAAGGSFTNPVFEQWKYDRILIADPVAGYWSLDAINGLVAIDATILASCIAVFKDRVFLAFNRTIQFTSANTYNDFSVVNGAGALSDNYPSLSEKIMFLKSTADYLYVIGDHAVHEIYGVSILSDGSTVFNNIDAIQQVGSLYPDTVNAIGSTVVLMGDTGINLAAGTSSQSISRYLEGLLPSDRHKFFSCRRSRKHL